MPVRHCPHSPLPTSNAAPHRVCTFVGYTVDPTVDTVTSAISEVIDNLKSNYLGLDVLNGNLSGSWPMCMISFVLVYTSVSSTDCSYMQGLLAFLAWSQLNPHVISEVETELNL